MGRLSPAAMDGATYGVSRPRCAMPVSESISPAGGNAVAWPPSNQGGGWLKLQQTDYYMVPTQRYGPIPARPMAVTVAMNAATVWHCHKRQASRSMHILYGMHAAPPVH